MYKRGARAVNQFETTIVDVCTPVYILFHFAKTFYCCENKNNANVESRTVSRPYRRSFLITFSRSAFADTTYKIIKFQSFYAPNNNFIRPFPRRRRRRLAVSKSVHKYCTGRTVWLPRVNNVDYDFHLQTNPISVLISFHYYK